MKVLMAYWAPLHAWLLEQDVSLYAPAAAVAVRALGL